MESGNNNLAYSSGYSKVIGGNSCTASSIYSAVGNSGLGNFALTKASGLDSMDNFFIMQSIHMTSETFIVKYYPDKSKWKIYNQGKLTIADNINMINCSSESKLFTHENKTIGCFIVQAKELQEIENGNFNLK